MTTQLPPVLHLEITSKCALACPACPRTYHQGCYKVTDLPLESIEQLGKLDHRFRNILLCGDHGDAIYHAQFHRVIETLKNFPGRPPLFIATNGSHRSAEWWEKTAQILDKNDEVIFGIDGLSDTSALYRRKSDWNSIVTGIRTLKNLSECRVTWQWILFRFNEDQLPEAAKVARDLRVDRFTIVESYRHEHQVEWRATISLAEAVSRFRRANDTPALPL